MHQQQVRGIAPLLSVGEQFHNALVLSLLVLSLVSCVKEEGVYSMGRQVVKRFCKSFTSLLGQHCSIGPTACGTHIK